MSSKIVVPWGFCKKKPRHFVKNHKFPSKVVNSGELNFLGFSRCACMSIHPSGLVGTTLCTTATVQNCVMHHLPALCTRIGTKVVQYAAQSVCLSVHLGIFIYYYLLFMHGLQP